MINFFAEKWLVLKRRPLALILAIIGAVVFIALIYNEVDIRKSVTHVEKIAQPNNPCDNLTKEQCAAKLFDALSLAQRRALEARIDQSKNLRPPVTTANGNGSAGRGSPGSSTPGNRLPGSSAPGGRGSTPPQTGPAPPSNGGGGNGSPGGGSSTPPPAGQPHNVVSPPTVILPIVGPVTLPSVKCIQTAITRC